MRNYYPKIISIYIYILMYLMLSRKIYKFLHYLLCGLDDNSTIYITIGTKFNLTSVSVIYCVTCYIKIHCLIHNIEIPDHIFHIRVSWNSLYTRERHARGIDLVTTSGFVVLSLTYYIDSKIIPSTILGGLDYLGIVRNIETPSSRTIIIVGYYQCPVILLGVLHILHGFLISFMIMLNSPWLIP